MKNKNNIFIILCNIICFSFVIIAHTVSYGLSAFFLSLNIIGVIIGLVIWNEDSITSIKETD